MKKQYLTPSVSVVAIDTDGLMRAHSIEVVDHGKDDQSEFYQPVIKEDNSDNFEAGAKGNDLWDNAHE